MAGKRILLAVLAHPDDETFGIGGTLALYARRGVEVYLVCATRGEAGEAEAKYLTGFNSIAELRESELRCAAEKLGLKEVIFLDYRDSGMPGSDANRHSRALINTSLDELARKIAECIRKIRPQVIITNDPMGGYRHPDHIHIHQATVKAFHLIRNNGVEPGAYAPQKLYFNTISRTILRWVVRLMPLFGKDPRKFGQNGDIDMKLIAEAKFPTNARINYSEVAEVRTEASNCYTSQGGRETNKGVAGLLRGWALSHEIFMLGYPQPKPGYVEKDLFENVVLDD